MIIFSIFFKMVALDFENVKILGAERLKTAKIRHHTKLRGDRPNRC